MICGTEDFLQLINILGYSDEENFSKESYRYMITNINSLIKLFFHDKKLLDTFIALGVNGSKAERENVFNANDLYNLLHSDEFKEVSRDIIGVDHDTLISNVWSSYISTKVNEDTKTISPKILTLYSEVKKLAKLYFGVEVKYDSTIECFYYLEDAIFFLAYCISCPEYRNEFEVSFNGIPLKKSILSFQIHDMAMVVHEFNVLNEDRAVKNTNFLYRFELAVNNL